MCLQKAYRKALCNLIKLFFSSLIKWSKTDVKEQRKHQFPSFKLFWTSFKVSTDEGSFATRTFVAICLLLVFNDYKQGQIWFYYLHLFVINKAIFLNEYLFCRIWICSWKRILKNVEIACLMLNNLFDAKKIVWRVLLINIW